MLQCGSLVVALDLTVHTVIYGGPICYITVLLWCPNMLQYSSLGVALDNTVQLSSGPR